MNLKTSNAGFKTHFLVALFLISLTLVPLLFTARQGGISKEEEGLETGIQNRVENCSTESDSCDFFSGKWVWDEESVPLYRESECSFMIGDYACEKHGRKDLRYQKWRWQPHGCNLPRFDGAAFLEKLRGKKLIFVGDSLNKNQWISLLCLTESHLPPSSQKSTIRTDNLFTFHAAEYNATIGFYWSPFLVESNCDDPYNHSRRGGRVIRINSIEKHARVWNDADILIFDSFGWWLDPIMIVLWGSFGSPDAIYKPVEMPHRRYEMVLETWSDWVEININRSRTRLFFMSLSPFHFFGETWEKSCNCHNATEPIQKEDYRGVMTDPEMMRLAESAIEKLGRRGVRVEYLNVTHMSDYRRDGHPSVYRKFFQPLRTEQLADPASYADCTHWCLPGVPDVWNQILYSYIVNSG